MDKVRQSITRVCLTAAFFIWLIFILPGCLGGGFHRIQGMSMFPTVMNNDVIFVLWGKKNPERGDLVTFKFEQRLLIKRLIGLPGDKIYLLGHDVILNGKLLREDYLYNDPVYEPQKFVLGEDEYFILGDNRDIALDSRYIGPIHRKSIVVVIGPYIRF